MEKPGLSIESAQGSWFGCLVDDHSSLVSSAFGSDPRVVQRHLAGYSRRTLGSTPKLARNALTREMIELFEGNGDSISLHLNESFVTSFQRKVIRIMSLIPKGRVTTYGQIARKLLSAPRPVEEPSPQTRGHCSSPATELSMLI